MIIKRKRFILILNKSTVLKINYLIQINPTDTGGCMCYTPLAEGDEKPSPAV